MQKYLNLSLRNQVNSWVLTAISNLQGRLSPLSKSPCPDKKMLRLPA
ncbi:MAG: hypothetical protein KAF91_02470 [Nostoc sp. TH1S01]|nr:hypothetical protein [Nostoc sp. TH1S01]